MHNRFLYFWILFFGFLALVHSETTAQSTRFLHGVASGDPLPNAVIIWTRVESSADSLCVNWQMARDTGMQVLVASGTAWAKRQSDHTVKVDVQGLRPNQHYYYEFEAQGQRSLRGRTQTAPAQNSQPDALRFGVVSCSNYANGYFNVYRTLAERNDLHAIIHLGDYLYEYGTKGYGEGLRPLEPRHELLNLQDYRQRHALYKRDPDLQRLHQQYPFIAVWDDHEIANDAWMEGAKNHNAKKEGAWAKRRQAAVQAYLEWMPLRVQAPEQPIYRRLHYGNLMDLYLLDTRLAGRSQQAGTANPDSSRTVLGKAQRDWWLSSMRHSEARWQVVGQQVMMAPFNAQPFPFLPPIFPNDDQWDGYAPARKRLFQALQDSSIQNLVVLTGDIHSAWAQDLPTERYDPITGEGSVGVEMVVSSVTSLGFGRSAWLAKRLFRMSNPHNHYMNLNKHGYLLLDVRPERVQGEWYFVDNIQSRRFQSYFERAYRLDLGKSRLKRQRKASRPAAEAFPPSAPLGIRPLPPQEIPEQAERE